LEFFIKITCPSAPSPPPLILTKNTVGELDRWQSGPFMQLDDEDNTEESNLSPPPIASLQWRMSRKPGARKCDVKVQGGGGAATGATNAPLWLGRVAEVLRPGERQGSGGCTH
jgi:hypothetical protein